MALNTHLRLAGADSTTQTKQRPRSGQPDTSRNCDNGMLLGRRSDSPQQMPEASTLLVAAIVPAHNEEERIGRVLEALLSSDAIDRVIVVNDGSTDRTSEIARRFCPRVIVEDLPQNRGKGGAMLHGVRAAGDCDVVLFVDADLLNLTSAHICALVEPVVNGQADMAVGQFKGGRGLTDLAQWLVPYISGQRAIRRELFLEVPDLDRIGYGIETAITMYVAKTVRRPVKMVEMRGVTHPMKEEKLGFVRGTMSRCRMYSQIISFHVRYSLHRGSH